MPNQGLTMTLKDPRRRKPSIELSSLSLRKPFTTKGRRGRKQTRKMEVTSVTVKKYSVPRTWLNQRCRGKNILVKTASDGIKAAKDFTLYFPSKNTNPKTVANKKKAVK